MVVSSLLEVSLMSSINRLLREELTKKFGKLSRSNGWWGIPCPFCGGKTNSRNMFVRIPNNDTDNVLMMKCFKAGCGFTDIVRPQHLIKLGIENRELIKMIDSNQYKNDRVIMEESNREYSFIMPKEYLGKDINDYLLTRTGKSFNDSYGMSEKMSIITDIKRFLDTNRDMIIDPDYRLKNIYKHPDKCICFINSTGTRLYVRYIDESLYGGKKHDKIPLIRLPDYSLHKPYSIYQTIDKNDIDGFYVFIGEGIFDIVNASIHYSGGVKSYLEATGSASAIRNRYLHLSKYLFSVKWVFMKDSDVDISFFKKIKRDYDYRFKYNPFVIYSTNTKDLGNISENPIPKREQI